MKIHLIAAARPNFMKIAPLYHALKKEAWVDPVIVHTGQHYDINMSDAFFKDLELPDPHIHLGIGSGSHAEQTGQVMIAYEKVLLKEKPALVVVVGDVNSTMACTIAASKIVYPLRSDRPTRDVGPAHRPMVAHLEAGLRSRDRTMPEEINRLVTDALADFLWTPSSDAVENLLNEGVDREKINNVGNIMIDSLEMMRAKIEAADAFGALGLSKGNYGLITLHRPSNVDSPDSLSTLCRMLVDASQKIPLGFPDSSPDPKKPTYLRADGDPAGRGGNHPGRADELYPFHEPCIQLPIRHHRFRGNPGGDHLPGHPLFNHASQYGTAGYGGPGHQSACAPWKTCSVALKASSRGKSSPIRCLSCGMGIRQDVSWNLSVRSVWVAASTDR